MFTGIEGYLIIWTLAVLVAYITFMVFKKLYLFTDYYDTRHDFQPCIGDAVCTSEVYNFSSEDIHGLSGSTAIKYREPSQEIFVEEIANEDAKDYPTDELSICRIPVIEEPTEKEGSDDKNEHSINATHQADENINYYNDVRAGIRVRQSVNIEDISRSDETAISETVNAYDCSAVSNILHVDESRQVNGIDEFNKDITEGQFVNENGFSPSDETTTNRIAHANDDCGAMSQDVQHADESNQVNDTDESINDNTEGHSTNRKEFLRSDEVATDRVVKDCAADVSQHHLDESEPGKHYDNDVGKAQPVNMDDLLICDETTAGKLEGEYNDSAVLASEEHKDVNVNTHDNVSDAQLANVKDLPQSDETAARQHHLDESERGKHYDTFSNDVGKGQPVNMDDLLICDETTAGILEGEYNDYSAVLASDKYKDVNVNIHDNVSDAQLANVKDLPQSEKTAASQANTCKDCSMTPDVFPSIDVVREMNCNEEFRNGNSEATNIEDENLKSDETPVGNITDVHKDSSCAVKKPVTMKKLKRFNKSFRKLCAQCVKGVKD